MNTDFFNNNQSSLVLHSVQHFDSITPDNKSIFKRSLNKNAISSL